MPVLPMIFRMGKLRRSIFCIVMNDQLKLWSAAAEEKKFEMQQKNYSVLRKTAHHDINTRAQEGEKKNNYNDCTYNTEVFIF